VPWKDPLAIATIRSDGEFREGRRRQGAAKIPSDLIVKEGNTSRSSSAKSEEGGPTPIIFTKNQLCSHS